MVENIAQGKYAEAVDSYSSLNISSKIRGTLIEKDDKNIKIDIGNNQALEIELRENIDIKSGETVLIDRRNIAKSKLVKLQEEISVDSSEIDVYSDILKKLDIEVTDENIKNMKKLDSYGVNITKENFESYMIAKHSLEEISNSLDYDSAIRLVEMDLDIENESIQKIAESLAELEEEKEGFNILKMFGKKEITTEQAEEIAKEIYGGKMGKDITDIIKSLYKNKVSITKKNVEKINDVFYKLHNLKDVEDKTFVDTMKNKLDISIDNLYKIKRYVKDEVVGAESEVIETKNIVNLKGYEVPTQEKRKITNKELRLLEEDIKDLMVDLELDISEVNIKLSKEFIKRNMDVTKENIITIDEMKKALEVVIKHLDIETASKIVKENIDIETADIKDIAEKIIEIKNLDKALFLDMKSKIENLTQEKTKLPELSQEIPVEEIEELKQELVKSIEKIETKTEKLNQDRKLSLDIKKDLPLEEVKELKQEVVKIVEKLTQDKMKSPELSQETPVEEIEELKQALVKSIEKIETKTEKLNQDRMLSLDIKKDLPLGEVKELKQEVVKILDNIENKVVETKNMNKDMIESQEKVGEAVKKEEVTTIPTTSTEQKEQEVVKEIMNKIEILKKVEEKDVLTLLEKNVDFKINKIEQVIFGKRQAVTINTIQDATYSASDIAKDTMVGIDKISTAFKDIGKIDFNTIAFQMKRSIPMTIMNIQKSTLSLSIENDQVQDYQSNEDYRVIQALNNNNVLASRVNIQKTMEVYRSYNNIKDNLTSNMIKAAIVQNIQIENMDVSLASKYIDQYRKSNPVYEVAEQMEIVNKVTGQDKEKYAKKLSEITQSIAENSEENIMFLIKNRKPLSFKELQETHFMHKNKNQLGHKISEMSEYINEFGDSDTKKQFDGLKQNILEISKSMKGSTKQVEEAYNKMENSIKDVEKNINLINQEHNSLMKTKSKEISEKLDENRVIARENDIIQFPLFMNGQFTNLNMYFRDKERESSKKNSEDISVVLSIDTVNMGNLNINLEIEKKNIDIKIGLENIEDINHIERYKDNLKELLEQDGFSVREIEFYREGKKNSFIKEETMQERSIISKGNLDVKI